MAFYGFTLIVIYIKLSIANEGKNGAQLDKVLLKLNYAFSSLVKLNVEF